MDYDDMKRKYLPKKNISLSFGVVFECPETFKMKNINKLIGDIYDALGEKGSVVYHRVYNEIVIIIRNDQPINFFAILKAIDRHVINIKLPLILYQKRDVIESLIEEICDDNCMAKLIVDTDVLISIAGKLKEVLNARKKILYCIEKLMNKEPMVYKGYISGDLMLRNKVRMFFVSKINDQEVILSGRKDIDYDVKTCLRPRNNLIEQAMYFDSTKLIYAFFYLRDNIEDILVENDCYIGYELTSVTTTKLCIKSFQMLNLKKCIRRLKVLFQDIIKMTYTNESILCTHKMFTFESSTDVDKRDSKRYLSIGLRSEVKKMVENSVNNYEIEIDIDYDLEDFLCGKKNGKINKICRNNDCDVVLCTKIEEGCKMMVLYISGCGTNLYKTLLSLENEYPAELGFHLQERHHRRIIGYGGKNIQRIMKKHGVYIKFMSEEERVLSGYDGNVIIKTPKRNETSLSKMKEEVVEMADEPCEDKDIEKRELDLYTYYEYFFEGALMLWNRILILKLLPPNIMIYLLSEISSNDIYNNEYVRIIEIPGCPEQFVYSFINLDLEVITSEKWIDKKPSLSFKLFDSVLLYAYEPMFKLDLKKSRGEIDFSDKIKEYDDDDIFAVGNRKKPGGGQTK